MTIQHNQHPEPDPSEPRRSSPAELPLGRRKPHDSSGGVPAQGLTVDRPGDCLALVRYTFGRLPNDSLVLIGLHEGATGGHLRLDFSAALDKPRHSAAKAASWLAGPQADPAPDAVLAAVITDTPLREQQTLGTTLMTELKQILEFRHNCPLVKTWYVGDGYVRDFDCTDPRCCPYPGLAAEDELAAALARSPQLNALPAASPPAHTIETFLGVPPAPNAPTEEMISSARGLTRGGNHGEPALTLWDDSLTEIISTGRCESALNPGHTALLLRSAEDDLLVQALAPLAAVGIAIARIGFRASAVTHQPEPMPRDPARQNAYQDYAAALTGTTGHAPDWTRVEALDALLHLLVPYQGPQRLNLLALKGWIEWAKGSGTSATLAIEKCLQENPDHLLAAFLAELFEASGPCPWARVKQLSHGWWQQ